MRGLGKNFNTFTMTNEGAITYGQMTNINYYGRAVTVVKAASDWSNTKVRLATNSGDDYIPLSEILILKQSDR